MWQLPMKLPQRSHDIDDAFTAGLLTIEELQGYLSLDTFDKLHKEIECICTQSEKLAGVYDYDKDNNDQKKEAEEFKNIRRLFVDRIDLLHTRISAEIVAYFIHDVITESREAMKKYSNAHKADAQCENCITETLVKFSDDGQALCSYLEKIISKKVINSPEVALFDEKASKIVFELFKAYYENPTLLHDGPKRRIFIEFRKAGYQDVLDHREADPFAIREEWKKITTTELENDKGNETKNIAQKRKILVRAICDFISGMTDSYAENEYRRIFKLG